MITFGSLFSGIGGFDLGFERAGMTCKWQCEIDKDCRTILEKHWKDITRYDDVKKIGRGNAESVDLICGGFPCQDVSIAGRRKGLAGERSGLWYEFARIIDELKPRWIVIENVPGLLSSNKGQDLLKILDTLAEFGFGVAWRILDAQFFGVPQRRRRIFIVGSFGNGNAGKVLFEQTWSVRDFEKSRRKGTNNSATIARCLTVREGQRQNDTIETLLPVWDFHAQDGDVRLQDNTLPTITARYGTGGNNTPYIGVRRLMPVECSRLQGFPDDWNSDLSDAKRYKQFGNAVSVPVAEWIGRRILEYGER